MIVHLCTQRSAVIIKNANLPGRESSAFTNILCSVCILCEVPAWHVGLHQDEGEDPIGYSLQPWKESVKSRAFRQQLHTFANKKLPSCLLILLRLFLTHQHVCTFLAFLKKAEGPSRHRISVKLQTFCSHGDEALHGPNLYEASWTIKRPKCRALCQHWLEYFWKSNLSALRSSFGSSLHRSAIQWSHQCLQRLYGLKCSAISGHDVLHDLQHGIWDILLLHTSLLPLCVGKGIYQGTKGNYRQENRRMVMPRSTGTNGNGRPCGASAWPDGLRPIWPAAACFRKARSCECSMATTRL